jgi:diguanylate cyclase (GGDEF)-like protein/PAS domain S-box-containing protein/putative nucleotidyltransferase with HDIG domain
MDDAFYKDCILNMPVGVAVVDSDGRLIEVNPKACVDTGYSEEELLALNLRRLIDRSSRVIAVMFFRDLKNTGRAECQMQIKTKAGELRWVSLNARASSDKLYTIFCQDITSYKSLEDDLVTSEMQYRTYINASNDMIYLKDDNLRYIIVNNALLDRFDREDTEIIGRTDEEALPEDFSRQTNPSDIESIITRTSTVSEMTIDDRIYEAVKFPVPIANGKTGVGAYIRDVTEKRNVQIKMENLLEQTQAMFNEHDAVMLLIRPETGQIIDANPAAVSFYGYTKEELLSLRIDDINMVKKDDEKEHRFQTDIKKQKYYSFPHRLKNGERRIVDVYSCPITYNNEKVLFSIIFDVTEREEAFDEIKYLSFHDHLTGLYNRRYFDNVLKLMNDERFMPLTIVMADVNGLKLVNDSFGHSEGDELLIKAAEIISEGCRKDDICARIGGDEFVIILPNTDGIMAGKIVRRIKKLQSKMRIRQLDLSMSFGFAVKESVSSNVELIVSEAENKMYKNKMHESARTRNKTVNIILKTLYEKCIGELDHSNRVSRNAAAIASAMGLDPETVSQIGVAGLLHDIGKIGVDESILNKTGVFTKADREAIEKHPESGWRILSNSDEYSNLAEYVLYHHESLDGKGYPRGLKGSMIPLVSKIITVCDAYDAMTSKRPYRKAMTVEEAVAELRRCAGTQFDEEVVDVFIEKVLKSEETH